MKARALRSTILVSQKVPARRWAGPPAGSRPGPGEDSGSGPVSLAFRLLSCSSGAAISGLSGRMRGERRAPGQPTHTRETTPTPSHPAYGWEDTPTCRERAPRRPRGVLRQ